MFIQRMDTPPPIPSATNPAPASPVAIRQAHLNTEASLRSIGLLYYLGAAISLFAIVHAVRDPTMTARYRIAMCILLILVAAIQIVTAGWLRKLDPRARVPATVLSGIGLLGFPIGTIISGYILYLLHSKMGKFVFTPEYRQIVATTPEIRYKMSFVRLLVIAFVALLVLLAVGAFVGLGINR